jgi:hypothetical protein
MDLVWLHIEKHSLKQNQLRFFHINYIHNFYYILPVKDGPVKFALPPNAVDVAFDTGLFISLVLSTFDKPTIDLDIPLTVPVKLD